MIQFPKYFKYHLLRFRLSQLWSISMTKWLPFFQTAHDGDVTQRHLTIAVNDPINFKCHILRWLLGAEQVLDRSLSKLLKNRESLHTLQKSNVVLQFVTSWRSRETHKCNFFSFSLWDQFLVFVLLKVHCYSQNDVSCGLGVATSNVPFSRLDLLFSVWLSSDYTDFEVWFQSENLSFSLC